MKQRHAPISRIYHLGTPAAPADPERVFARVWRRCRDLWLDCGTIAVKPDELPEELRAPMVAWANDTYGERRQQRRNG